MPTPATPRLVEALDRRVVAFQTPAFSLAEDLDWLDRLRALRAPVGVILHGSRILEVLARHALALGRLSVPRDGLHHCLRLLCDYQLLARPAYRLLDRLRDLGNKARHVLRKVTFADAEHGYALVLRGLHWYFCEFPRGLGLKGLGVHNQPLDALLPTELASLLALLEAADLDERTFLSSLHLERHHCPLLLSPVLAAVVVERLLDGDRAREAETVLKAVLDPFPDDVRLRQLHGLLCSRTGRLAEACTRLEAIATTDSAADEETQGILAGAYKRRAEAEPGRRREWLQACHDRYEQGWRGSQGANPYLGINAAATALWLGLSGQTAPIAQAVRDVLESRRQGLEEAGEAVRSLNCWDQLTLAEAHLLLQQWDAARQHYHEAQQRFPRQTAALDVAREQAHEDLAALGRPDLIGTMFPG